MLKHSYNPKQYNFQELIRSLFKVGDLCMLHKHEQYAAVDGLSGLGNDTHSKYHQIFYKKLRNDWKEFTSIYKLFIKNEVFPLFQEEKTLIYQTLPSFRIQYPNAKAVTTIHCDSDKNHKHPLGELNVLIPLTEMNHSSAVWMESLPNLADWKPINLNQSEFILWNGNRCRHFNKTNRTGKTRVSLDFRVLPRSCYNPDYNMTTATTKQKFVVGEYYSELTEI